MYETLSSSRSYFEESEFIMATTSSQQKQQWSPPKPSYNSPKPSMKSYSTPKQSLDDQMFIRDEFLISMERMHNWSFKDSHSIQHRQIQERYAITCSPKSHSISLFEDDDVSSSNASLSTEQSVFEGWDELEARQEQDRMQVSPKQHLLASKKWASSTAKALSSKKLFNMSNRVMNDISSSISYRNDSFFEEILEGAQSPMMNRYGRFPSSASRDSMDTSSPYQSAWGSFEGRKDEMIGLGLEDLHEFSAKMEKPFRQTGSPLSFDPLRRPRAPFPQEQGDNIPKKAAMLLGTYTDQNAVSPLSQPIQSPSIRSPCPDRMNGISAIARPKPQLPLKSPIRPPTRPKRPTESDIFADMIDEPKQQQPLATRPPRPTRRLPKALPVPTTPLPDVPVSPKDEEDEDDVATPIGWVNEGEDKKKASNYSAYNKFAAELIDVEGSFDRERSNVIVEVGGMQFSSTFSTLCPRDIPLRQVGLASWLRTIGEGLDDLSDQSRSHSITSSEDDYDHGLSTVENSPSVRTPGLFEHPYNPLEKSIALRNNLANLPKSVSNDSQLSDPKIKPLFAYDTDVNAPRNSFGMDFAPRRTSSCSDLQRIPQSKTASLIDQMPALVFTPQSHKQKQQKLVHKQPQQTSTSTLFIILPNDRNPLCYPIILHLLQFGKLPAYFSTQNTKNQFLLRDIRQECFWLGYTHLSHLCT